MSKIYQLKEGDDIREIRIELISDEVAESAVLVISKGSTRVVRDLELDSVEWTYRFTDADFEELVGNNTYKVEVYATFSDGTNGTYPTVGTAQLRVYSRL